MSRRALVAGAGIGGLTAALALAREDFRVEIFERAPVLEEFGAGLQLTPNATRVLKRLGALEAVGALAATPRAIRILRGGDGAELANLPIEDAERRWGAPYLVIHRADLQRALAERATRLPNVALHLGTEVAGVGADGGGVSIGLVRGLATLREAGDVLVGADGLRSLVRERIGLGAADAARFSGRVAFRATVAASKVAARARAAEVTLRLGAKAHLVHYPLRGGRIVNLVAVIEFDVAGRKGRPPLGRRRGPADARAGVRRLVARRARPHRRRGRLEGLAALRSPADPAILVRADRAPRRRRASNDAVSRARGGAGDRGRRRPRPAPRRLRRRRQGARRLFGRSRRTRRRACSATRWRKARIYHLSGPLAFARDLAMRALGPRRLLRRYDWLYSG